MSSSPPSSSDCGHCVRHYRRLTAAPRPRTCSASPGPAACEPATAWLIVGPASTISAAKPLPAEPPSRASGSSSVTSSHSGYGTASVHLPNAGHECTACRLARRGAPGDSCRSHSTKRSSVILCGATQALRPRASAAWQCRHACLLGRRRKTGSLVAADSETLAQLRVGEAGCPVTARSAQRKTQNRSAT